MPQQWAGMRSEPAVSDDRAAARNGRRGARGRSAGDEIEIPRVPHATASVVVTRRLIREFGQAGKSDAPRAGTVKSRQQIGFPLYGDIARGRKSSGGSMGRRSKHVFGRIGQPAKMAFDCDKAFLEGHERVEPWLEPSRALRSSGTDLATQGCVERRPIGDAGDS